MTSKIFKSILSVAIAVLLASLVIMIGVLYPYFGDIQESQLKDEVSLAADATEQLGKSYLEGLEDKRYRLTWVASDGTVLFDSHADAAVMENHKEREEIKEALVSGAGSSARWSAPLTEQTIYEATRLADGSVLRISVSRAIILIDDIIRLSQLDEGTEMPREDVSLKILAEEVCETLADAARRKEVTLEVDGEDGVLQGVRRLLYEVVYNLCDNAIKYNKPCGSVKVCVAQKPGEVLLIVQDTGIGIALKHQDKVFERFYRVDKSHSKQSGGTGLGLSIVKHAVQYHHGRIAMESEPNNGTTISVCFDTRV